MSITLYDISVPPFIKQLKALSKILAKGLAHVNNDESKLIHAKLIDDQGDLVFQIQRLSDTAKGLAVRVGGVENVASEDNETDFAGLYTRINRTIEILEAVPSNSTDGKEKAEITLKIGPHEQKFTAKDYVLHFAIPNFYFHVVTAYDILRKEGVPVGKGDYLGRT
ncbi:hypothetical protein DSL72_009340 [Monilinia vaccinii-corymbosi]|uniref:DUF1993 domain-containing protein n=1 Tax=Monilinia vaccinii-corymbosi TaxID=61207 RepID=A0A8A3PR36_9HELO|nr:hypothetical protein DSL72_009340 [Monilinia vaccinii-corymbosi]